MESRAHAFVAGLFVVVLGLAAIASLVWFGGKREAMRELIIVTHDNVTGLNPQSAVRYRGIPVGKVKDIQLDPKNLLDILILVEVREDLPLTEGTTARLGYQGVTGMAHVLLEDKGQDVDLLPKKWGQTPRIMMQPSLFQELGDAGSMLLRDGKELIGALKELLKPENRQRFEKILAHTEDSSSKIAPAMEQLTANLAALRQVLSPDNIERINRAAAASGPMLEESQKLIVSLQSVSGKVEQLLGESTAGSPNAALPRINRLAEDISSTTHQLNRVLRQLENSPNSLLLFGAGSPAPGPGEKGFSSDK